MIENSIGWDNAKYFAILAMFGCGAGIVMLVILNDLLALVMFSALGLTYPLIVWLRDNVMSPNRIEFDENGFYAHFRFQTIRFINWDDVTNITYIPTDATRFAAGKKGGGHFTIKQKGSPYALKEEVALLMREKYFERLGRYPPTLLNEGKT